LVFREILETIMPEPLGIINGSHQISGESLTTFSIEWKPYPYMPEVSAFGAM